MTEQVVIVGADLAAAMATQTLRSDGFTGNITLIGAEPHRPCTSDRRCPRDSFLERPSQTTHSSIQTAGTPTTTWTFAPAAWPSRSTLWLTGWLSPMGTILATTNS